jgi:CBS-domain-containing membrane protein
MSARAAWRLESLGFTRVYRYTAGKMDWFAAGLPREGRQAHTPRAGDIVRPDVPTCRLTDIFDDVRARVRAAGWKTCIVVNDRRVVLGRLRARELDSDAEPAASVESVMQSGPPTFRPDVTLEELTEHLRTVHLDTAVITTADGELMGLLSRKDAEHRLHEAHTPAGARS